MSNKEYNTILAELRTLLALERNALAEERTAFAELRTGLALLAISPSISAILTILFDLGDLQLLVIISFFGLTGLGLVLSLHAQNRLTRLRKHKTKIINQELKVIQTSPDATATFENLINPKSNALDPLE